MIIIIIIIIDMNDMDPSLHMLNPYYKSFFQSIYKNDYDHWELKNTYR